MDSDFWCIAKFSGSRSTGTLHFFPTGETRSPATPSHHSRCFPLLKKYSHHQDSNQIRIDRLQSPICRQSLFLLLLSIGYLVLGLCPLAFLRRLVRCPSATNSPRYPPAQPLLSLILITAFPQAQLYSYKFDRLLKETILQNKSLSSPD